MVNNSFSKLMTFHSIQTVSMLEFLPHHASITQLQRYHKYAIENSESSWNERKKLFIDHWWHLSRALGVSGQERMLFHASFWHRMLLISDVVLWKWKLYYMDNISIQFIITHSQSAVIQRLGIHDAYSNMCCVQFYFPNGDKMCMFECHNGSGDDLLNIWKSTIIKCMFAFSLLCW